MSSFTSFASGAASPTNPDDEIEIVGAGTGDGTTITGNASANSKGSYSQITAATASAWRGFWLDASQASVSGGRHRLYFSLDGGSTDYISDVFVQPGNNRGPQRFYIPLQIPAASSIHCAMRTTNSAATIKILLAGLVSSPTSAPGYTVATLLTGVETANTQPSTQTVAAQASATAWTEFVASTGAAYGAFLLSACTLTAPTSSKGAVMRLAQGAAASEVAIGGGQCPILNAATGNGDVSLLINNAVASGQRLSVNLQAPSDADVFYVSLHGFR
jgi:hypothetical protein